ncbi:MAG: ribulose phosphate epimerase [Deltaproteobacteria bacterium]|nr:ribulose phosphate epimerase [Deltaproteobacteria bacterium]
MNTASSPAPRIETPRMHRSAMAWVVSLACSTACSPTPTPESDPGPIDMTTGTTTDSPPPVPGSSSGSLPPPTPDPSTSEGTADTTAGIETTFLSDPDGGRRSFECDLFEQDCPRGEKCMPWANDGGNAWNATHCTPIAVDPGAPGDACTVEGNRVSGIDTCQLGSMCWNVDPATLEGTCVAFCVGPPESPTCDDPDTFCNITANALPLLCLPSCNPLNVDCPAGQSCVPHPTTNFTCAPDASGDAGAPGDPCKFINTCDPGSFCASIENVPDCTGPAGCCSAFCDLTDPAPPCLPGQQCSPWFDGVPAPPMLDNLGYCGVPL